MWDESGMYMSGYDEYSGSDVDTQIDTDSEDSEMDEDEDEGSEA